MSMRTNKSHKYFVNIIYTTEIGIKLFVYFVEFSFLLFSIKSLII